MPGLSPKPKAPRSAKAARERTLELSRYARHAIAARPDLAPWEKLHLRVSSDEMRSLLAQPIDDEATLFKALRELRKRVLLRVIARDLNGLADLAEVVATTTALAEISITFAASHIQRWAALQYGAPAAMDGGRAADLHVIGMGKLGGDELNVSSDVDLVFVYPEDGATVASGDQRSIDHHELFTRVARRLIAAIGEITGDGFVFRVDMRLRPDGEAGPLVASFAALENYLITQGREWERYAWLKARVLCGGDRDTLMALVRPFVFRRHLDFSALASMRELHAQVRRDVARRGRGEDIKLGPGGIREIEFIAQVFQLIRGGRDADLRVRPTLQALDNLRARGLLPEDAAMRLRDAYVFLRNLEHRLQYLDDRQTQTLPRNPPDQLLIARALNFASYAELIAALDLHRANVTREFELVFVGVGEPAGAVAAPLAAHSYRNAEEAERRVHEFRASSRYRQMPAAAQARLDALLPRLIDAAANFDNADATLERLLKLIESIGRRESYFAFLLEYPQALTRVATLASASIWASEYLARHPILLDELLESQSGAAPDWKQLADELERQLADGEDDIETQMNTLRHFKHSRTFRSLIADLAGEMRLEKLSDDLSYLADLCLSETQRLCWRALAGKRKAKPKFAIVGYGKLGGKELGYASDLDIIFLYDDDSADAPPIYARLAQRINSWLTSVTPAGVLYETDLRLRPNGQSGLLVSSIAAFEEYQTTQAWVWEHQALTRARFAAGDARVGRAFEKIRERVLCKERDLESLRGEIIAMREKMLAAHPNPTGLFDIKHDRGGIIDVEFIVQYLVLGHAHSHKELTANIGNLALLKLAARLGLIPTDLAEQSHGAYHQYRRLQHALRLQNERYARVAAESVAEQTTAVQALWQRVFAADR